MHPEKLTVSYDLWAGCFIGPYFFSDAMDRNVTRNDKSYFDKQFRIYETSFVHDVRTLNILQDYYFKVNYIKTLQDG